MRLLDAVGMRAAEEAAVLAGTSYEQLMENAGQATARQLAALMAAENREANCLFVCGRGNNAGDAFVAARLLSELGWRCAVLPLCGDDYSTLAKRNLLRLPKAVAQLTALPAELPARGFVVDGVFGIGFHGQLAPAVQTVFREVNSTDTLRVALDIPSGMDCDTGDVSPGTFHAHHTFTFGAYKPGLLVMGNSAYTGEVTLLDIGL